MSPKNFCEIFYNLYIFIQKRETPLKLQNITIILWPRNGNTSKSNQLMKKKPEFIGIFVKYFNKNLVALLFLKSKK